MRFQDLGLSWWGHRLIDQHQPNTQEFPIMNQSYKTLLKLWRGFVNEKFSVAVSLNLGICSVSRFDSQLVAIGLNVGRFH